MNVSHPTSTACYDLLWTVFNRWHLQVVSFTFPKFEWSFVILFSTLPDRLKREFDRLMEKIWDTTDPRRGSRCLETHLSSKFCFKKKLLDCSIRCMCWRIFDIVFEFRSTDGCFVNAESGRTTSKRNRPQAGLITSHDGLSFLMSYSYTIDDKDPVRFN